MREDDRQHDEKEPVEKLSVSDATEHIFQESRMLLPGAVTLFGFQLVVVFNRTFQDRLGVWDQRIHLLALLLIAVTIALLMAPATFDLQVQREEATRRFIRIATFQLNVATLPLAIALTLEIYLVTHIVILDRVASALIAAGILMLYLGLWYVFPRLAARSVPPDGP